MYRITLALIGIVLGCGGAVAATVQFGVGIAGGLVGFSAPDFTKSADDATASLAASPNTAGSATAGRLGWLAGAHVIAELPSGLGFVVGVQPEGGAVYDATLTNLAAKKGTGVTVTTSARLTQTRVPVGVRYRSKAGDAVVSGEVGVDPTWATVSYSETNSSGGSVSGDLTDSGVGFHVALEAAIKLRERTWGFLQVGYLAVTLNDFSGTLNDNGSPKDENLYMFKDSATGRELLGVSTSTSVTSTDHRLADVSGAGVRVALGVRVLFQ